MSEDGKDKTPLTRREFLKAASLTPSALLPKSLVEIPLSPQLEVEKKKPVRVKDLLGPDYSLIELTQGDNPYIPRPLTEAGSLFWVKNRASNITEDDEGWQVGNVRRAGRDNEYCTLFSKLATNPQGQRLITIIPDYQAKTFKPDGMRVDVVFNSSQPDKQLVKTTHSYLKRKTGIPGSILIPVNFTPNFDTNLDSSGLWKNLDTTLSHVQSITVSLYREDSLSMLNFYLTKEYIDTTPKYQV